MKKLLAVGVIVLFLGVAIAPSINASDNSILPNPVVNTVIEEIEDSSNMKFPNLYALIDWWLDFRFEQAIRIWLAGYYFDEYNLPNLALFCLLRGVCIGELVEIQYNLWIFISNTLGWGWFE